jgi:hypothetical protein
MNLAPHGSAAFTISAWANVLSSIGGPEPEKNTLGRRKNRAAAVTRPARNASDQPLITRTASGETPAEALAGTRPRLEVLSFAVDPHPPTATAIAATIVISAVDTGRCGDM